MKSKYVLVLLPLMSIALTSCSQVRKYEEHLDDYVFIMKYHQNFNVLQLTDIHWNANTSTMASKIYLEKLFDQVDKHIKEEQGSERGIDLVELTGDQFMLATSYQVSTFLEFMEKQAEKHGFKYAAIWGNHDRHGIYNPNWLADSFKKASHCIYTEPNDNLYGRSNFVINLTEDGTTATSTKWQLANVDSGASFSDTAISPFRDYDYVRKDQTDWWVKEHAKVGEEVPTIAYYHIPQDENQKAWDMRKEQGFKNKFFRLEGFGDNGTGNYESNFVDEGARHNLKAVFSGHAHNVDWTVEYRDPNWEADQKSVILGLGVKTGSELYFAHVDASTTDPDMKEGLESVGITENFDLIGASLVTITDNPSLIEGKFDIQHLYFNERTNEDFVRWVKW